MKLKKLKPQLHKDDDSKKEILRYFSMTGLMIPAVLLSILFVKLVTGDLTQPRAVTAAIEKDKNNFARRLQLAFFLLENRDARIVANEKGNETIYNLKAINGEFDMQGIHHIAVEMKAKYPEVFKAIVNVTDTISQKEVKNILEKIRKHEKSDAEIFIVDEKTHKKISLKVLFTDIDLTNKAEG